MFETSVNFRDYSIGTIQVNAALIRAEGAPEYPRLFVPTKLSIRPVEPPFRAEPQFDILNVQSSLFLQSHPQKIADSTVIFSILEFSNRVTSWTYQVEFALDPRRIQRLEEDRRGGDMKLRLEFGFVVGLYRSVIIQENNEQKTRRFLEGFEMQSTRPQVAVDIPQSHWAGRVLPGLGLGEYFIIEIPKGTGAIPDAWGYLEKAEVAFKNWDNKGVFSNCRELGELLDKNVKAHFGANVFSYKERWRRAYDNFKDLASLELHLEGLKKSTTYSPDSVKTNKADAEHLILRAKALIKFAGALLEE